LFGQLPPNKDGFVSQAKVFSLALNQTHRACVSLSAWPNESLMGLKPAKKNTTVSPAEV
jgi:hypothetical protein